MEVIALQAFVAVAKSGSFSLAAKTLFLTQPAVSKRIATLEDELRVYLFDRIGRKIQLTEAGRALLPKAKELVNEVADLKRFASNLTGDIAGSLIIGTSHHIGLHRLPPVLRQFTDDHPKVQLDIHFLDSEAACRGVETGELEVAIVTLPAETSNKLRQTIIWNDPLEFVVAADHHLTKKASLTLEELVEYPAVLPGLTTFTRGILDQELANHHLEIKVNMSTNYLETIKMLVSINQGWSLLPATMVDQELASLHLPLQLKRELGIVIHSGRTLSNAAKALCDTLHEHQGAELRKGLPGTRFAGVGSREAATKPPGMG